MGEPPLSSLPFHLASSSQQEEEEEEEEEAAEAGEATSPSFPSSVGASLLFKPMMPIWTQGIEREGLP